VSSGEPLRGAAYPYGTVTRPYERRRDPMGAVLKPWGGRPLAWPNEARALRSGNRPPRAQQHKGRVCEAPRLECEVHAPALEAPACNELDGA
jgi:hypothetical protein